MVNFMEINGRTIPVPDDLQNANLLDFLRDHLELRGTKYGCGIGLCGACTVHLDGKAARACQVQVSELGNAQVTSIEGLADASSGGGLHPLQQAWIDKKVPQCGYCQTGQIMTAAALLQSNPAPSNDEIVQAMNGNLCRCGTYGRILAAVKHAAGAL